MFSNRPQPSALYGCIKLKICISWQLMGMRALMFIEYEGSWISTWYYNDCNDFEIPLKLGSRKLFFRSLSFIPHTHPNEINVIILILDFSLQQFSDMNVIGTYYIDVDLSGYTRVECLSKGCSIDTKMTVVSTKGTSGSTHSIQRGHIVLLES